MDELKSCPFCEGDTSAVHHDPPTKRLSVICRRTKCLALGPWRDTVDDARAAWNSRAPSPVPAPTSASNPSLRARCEQLEQDIAVLSTAFHEVLADHHTDDSTFQVRKEQYLRAAMEENKMIEAMLPHFLEVAGMKLSEPVPAPEPVREKENKS